MRDLEIALIGAGIGGLAAARALQLAGFRVRVYEQAPALGEVGAGLTISPNATHVLHALGLERTMREIGMRPARGGVKHWKTSETMVSIDRGDGMVQKYGAPYYQVHRADLHEALARAVLEHDPHAVRLGFQFAGIEQTGDRVELRFANGQTVRVDVAIGADGLRSSMRAALFGGERPRFTGYVAWRGLVPVSALPAGLVEPPSCVSIGPGHTFTRYLVRQGRLLNYVALAERSDWQVEGWSVRSDVREVLDEFVGWYEGVRTIIAATPPDLCYKWALFDRDPLPTWIRGRAALLGDAAHPMLPYLGQGAAMALEDALVLARTFESSGSVEEALRRYEAARLERTTFVMLKSRETARTYHTGDPGNFESRSFMSAESLGLMDYDARNVAA